MSLIASGIVLRHAQDQLAVDRPDLFAYIEGYYNRRRIHSAIGYITPEQADRKTA